MTTGDVDKLQAEIQQNRSKIIQLQRRNAHLAQQIRSRDLAASSTIPVNDSSTVRPQRKQTVRATSRNRKSKRQDKSVRRWISIVIAAVAIAVICGILGFTIAKLLTGR
jgi:anti-sigma-K factor RskA